MTACAVGSDFTPPAAALPSAWSEVPAGARDDEAAQSSVALSWAGLNDPVLDGLLTRAGSGNLDILAAVERIEAARIQRGGAAAEGRPTLNGQIGYNRNRLSTAGVGEVLRDLVGVSPENAVESVRYSEYSLGGAASWEIDLWGRYARLHEAADAELSATRQDAAAVRRSTEAEIARTLFQWRRLDHAVGTGAQAVAMARAALEMASAGAERGLIALSDLDAARSKVRAATATLSEAESQRDMTRRALAVLVGGRPDTVLDELDVPGDTPEPHPLPPTLPSDLARNRPDILAAEHRLHAATAGIGVAQADFYPRFSLSGEISLDALKLSELGWNARNTAIGPSLSIPLFSGGRLERQLELRRSHQRGAALAYQATLIAAWREVEDAFALDRIARARVVALEADVADQDKRLFRLARQHARGDLSRAALLEAQAERLEVRARLRDQQAERLLARVALISALGPRP